MKLNFKRLENGLPLPSYGSEEASGMDIRAAEEGVVLSLSRAIIRTGFAVEIPKGYELQVRPRSGLAAKNGITVLNSPGTIDSDYRGEIMVILYNTTINDFVVSIGDRIAQLVLAPVTRADIQEVNELDKTERGHGGFGSTGRN